MTDTGLVKTIRCEGCGRALKPVALFCTACGTPRDIEAPAAPSGEPAKSEPAKPSSVAAPPKAARSTCASCGSALRPGAEFCTACGTKSAPIDLTEVVGKEGDPAAPPSPSERVSPAASRAILSSVGGGMGSYVGKSAKGAGGAVPPVLPIGDDAADGGRKNLAIIAIVAAVLLVIGGIAVLVATQKSSDGSLKAGAGSHGQHEGSIKRGDSGGSASDSTTGSSKDDGSSTSASSSATSSRSGSDSHGDSTTGSTGVSTSGSSSDSSSSGSNSPSRPGAASPTAPSTAAQAPPAQLWVSTNSVSLNGDNTATVTIRNTGGRSMYWSISNRDMDDNGNLSVNGGGTLAGGSNATVTVGWSGGSERVTEGSFQINGAGDSVTVNVHGNNLQQDVMAFVGWGGCGTSCPKGTYETVRVSLRANGGATPELPTQICFNMIDKTYADAQCYVERGQVVAGGYYQVRLPFNWNSFNPGTDQVKIWADYPSGLSTKPATLTIYP